MRVNYLLARAKSQKTHTGFSMFVSFSSSTWFRKRTNRTGVLSGVPSSTPATCKEMTWLPTIVSFGTVLLVGGSLMGAPLNGKRVVSSNTVTATLTASPSGTMGKISWGRVTLAVCCSASAFWSSTPGATVRFFLFPGSTWRILVQVMNKFLTKTG